MRGLRINRFLTVASNLWWAGISTEATSTKIANVKKGLWWVIFSIHGWARRFINSKISKTPSRPRNLALLKSDFFLLMSMTTIMKNIIKPTMANNCRFLFLSFRMVSSSYSFSDRRVCSLKVIFCSSRSFSCVYSSLFNLILSPKYFMALSDWALET